MFGCHIIFHASVFIVLTVVHHIESNFTVTGFTYTKQRIGFASYVVSFWFELVTNISLIHGIAHIGE